MTGQDWPKIALESGNKITIPDHAVVLKTESAVFVEAYIQIDRCRECGDALLPCGICKKVGCSNGLCACSKHTCLDTEE